MGRDASRRTWVQKGGEREGCPGWQEAEKNFCGGRLASVFTESRGGGHLVAFTTVRGFLSPFFSLSFPDGGGMGGRWTPVEKLLSSAFKKGQGRREGGRLSRSWRSRVNISGQGWARSSFSFAISEITRMRVRTIRFMHLNG